MTLGLVFLVVILAITTLTFAQKISDMGFFVAMLVCLSGAIVSWIAYISQWSWAMALAPTIIFTIIFAGIFIVLGRFIGRLLNH